MYFDLLVKIIPSKIVPLVSMLVKIELKKFTKKKIKITYLSLLKSYMAKIQNLS